MKKLLAGPWLGEFGWELCSWIPAIRHYAWNSDNEVAIVCQSGHNYLYEDFIEDIYIINYDKKGRPDRWLLNEKKVHIPKRIKAEHKKHVVVEPCKKVCMSWKRQYFKYGKKDPRLEYDLVIHARACTKYGQRSCNWPKPRYRMLLEKLKLKKVCCIGTDAHYIEGTEDLRRIQLDVLCDILASSKVMLTPSSGPGHLASLCGCPHVIMTYDKYLKIIKGTNKDRYKKIWNPFDTPCKVLENNNWQPPVDKVVKAVGKFI